MTDSEEIKATRKIGTPAIITQARGGVGRYGIFLDGVPGWPNDFGSEDAAKQMLRKLQKAMNRHGYDPRSEQLTVEPLGSSA